MNIEKTIAEHYGRDGLVEAILEKARAEAPDPDNLTVDDLATLDEMHIGGRKGTEHFMPQLDLVEGMQVLDVGSGIGGPARYAAATFQVHVTGIDLTPSYAQVAAALSEAVNLEGYTYFETGSATAMPFNDEFFDAAYTMHAGMNIKDKQKLYQEVGRVLKPGSVFGIYEVMAGQNSGDMTFPVPWADTQDTSFLIEPRAIEAMLADAGFKVLHMENRRDFAISVFTKLREIMQAGFDKSEPPIRSADFPVRVDNLLGNIEKGFCTPWEMICRKV